MNFIKLNIYGTEFGINKITQIYEIKGNTATEIDAETAESIIGKFVVRAKGTEQVATAFYADNEENQKLVKDIKVLCMMLKSKEMYGDYGIDASLGRLYAEDVMVDETNWNEL